METVKIVLMAVALVGVVVIGILELWAKLKGGSVWQEVADHFGFVAKGSNTHEDKRMLGTHRGIKLRLRGRTDYEEVGRGIKKTKMPRYFTVFRAHLDDGWDAGGEILPRDRLLTMAGPSAQVTGYDAFDTQYEVGGRVPEDLVVALQNPEALRALRRLKNTFGDFQIANGQIIVEVQKRFTSKGQFVRYIDELVEAAVGLNKALKNAEATMAPSPEAAVDELAESTTATW